MNTYKDDPSKGLSKFQKSVLLRIDEKISLRDVDFIVWVWFPRNEADRIYWGMVGEPMDVQWRVKYSRVKKSLLNRGLIQYAGSPRLINLTDIGKSTIDKIKNDNN